MADSLTIRVLIPLTPGIFLAATARQWAAAMAALLLQSSRSRQSDLVVLVVYEIVLDFRGLKHERHASLVISTDQ